MILNHIFAALSAINLFTMPILLYINYIRDKENKKLRELLASYTLFDRANPR